MAPLTGKALVAKVKELTEAGVSKSAQAAECGYVRIVQSGEREGDEMPNVAAFLEALVEANGIAFPEGARGFKPNGALTLNKNGQLTIGQGYLRQLGLVPGAKVAVEVIEESKELVVSAA